MLQTARPNSLNLKHTDMVTAGVNVGVNGTLQQQNINKYQPNKCQLREYLLKEHEQMSAKATCLASGLQQKG